MPSSLKRFLERYRRLLATSKSRTLRKPRHQVLDGGLVSSLMTLS